MLTTALCVLIIAAAIGPAAFASEAPRKALRIGIVGRMEPLLFVDDEGQANGAFADMMVYIAAKSGNDIEYVVFGQSMEALGELSASNVDAVLGVFPEKISNYPTLDFSRELYAGALCVTSAKSVNSNDDGLYGTFEAGTVEQGLLVPPEAYSYYVLNSQDTVLNDLINGRSNRIIALRDCVTYRLEKSNLGKAFTIGSANVGYISFGIAFRKTDELQRGNINSAITALRSDSKYESILKKWDIQTELEAANARTARLLKIIGYSAAGVALIVLFFTGVSMRLRSLVKAKTAELSEKVDDLENASSLRNALIEQASAGSMVLRLDGTILLMNDAMRKLAGLSDGDVVTNIGELSLINKVWELSPPEMNQPELYTERDSEGQLHTYRYQNHRTAKHDERVFIIEDISREEAEKQEAFEEDKNRALNRIIAGLAHEIKNPLTTLKAYAFLAQSPDEDPEFYDSFSKYVPGEINRISSLVESLVNYSRPIRGQVERIRIADVADSCLGLAYVTSKNKITIENNIDRDLFIKTNADQLRQALINFLLNSIDSVEEAKAAGKENCFIRLSVYRRGDKAVIEVYDTGKGMSDEQIRSCTDPFYTTKEKGTGMGLALTKQFAKENDGTLEIESVEGEYTIMRMIFAEDTVNE